MLERTSIYRAKQRISVLHGRNRYPLILLRITPSRSNPLSPGSVGRPAIPCRLASRLTTMPPTARSSRTRASSSTTGGSDRSPRSCVPDGRCSSCRSPTTNTTTRRVWVRSAADNDRRPPARRHVGLGLPQPSILCLKKSPATQKAAEPSEKTSGGGPASRNRRNPSGKSTGSPGRPRRSW